MELHEDLYALGLRLGREVFDDPDTFRGALDDFLDEDAATTGDINLLVDAVRLGAFSSMASMIGSGAQVSAAVEEAGSRLARDRGSADVAGAQWACAVLGFAIGKVTDVEVRRYRTQHAGPQSSPSQSLPPTQFPAQQPARPQPAPTVAPTQQPTAQPYGPGGQNVVPEVPRHVSPPAPPSFWPGGPQPPRPPQPKKRRTWPIIVAAAAAVAVIAGGAVAVVATQGGDNRDPGNGKRSPKVEEVPVDLESVQERYAGLADDATAELDECEAADAEDGTTEVLECGFANGTLTLTTYESRGDLVDERNATATLDAGSVFSATDAGIIYSVAAESAVSDVDASSLYWDSTVALQSGEYVASSSTVTAEQLVEQYNKTQGVVAYPTDPEDEGMLSLAEEFLKVEDCNRISTIYAGELEESICTAPNGIYVFMGVFKYARDFRDFRRTEVDEGKSQGYPLRTWNFGGGQQEGSAAEYINDSNEAVRYWDKPECRCYMRATLDGGDIDALRNWWTNA